MLSSVINYVSKVTAINFGDVSNQSDNIKAKIASLIPRIQNRLLHHLVPNEILTGTVIRQVNEHDFVLQISESEFIIVNSKLNLIPNDLLEFIVNKHGNNVNLILSKINNQLVTDGNKSHANATAQLEVIDLALPLDFITILFDIPSEQTAGDQAPAKQYYLPKAYELYLKPNPKGLSNLVNRIATNLSFNEQIEIFPEFEQDLAIIRNLDTPKNREYLKEFITNNLRDVQHEHKIVKVNIDIKALEIKLPGLVQNSDLSVLTKLIEPTKELNIKELIFEDHHFINPKISETPLSFHNEKPLTSKYEEPQKLNHENGNTNGQAKPHSIENHPQKLVFELTSNSKFLKSIIGNLGLEDNHFFRQLPPGTKLMFTVNSIEFIPAVVDDKLQNSLDLIDLYDDVERDLGKLLQIKLETEEITPEGLTNKDASTTPVTLLTRFLPHIPKADKDLVISILKFIKEVPALETTGQIIEYIENNDLPDEIQKAFNSIKQIPNLLTDLSTSKESGNYKIIENWKGITIPIIDPDNQMSKILFAIKDEQDKEDGQKFGQKKWRRKFIVETRTTPFGLVQFKGSVSHNIPKEILLTIKSSQVIPKVDQSEMLNIFANVLSMTESTGQLNFDFTPKLQPFVRTLSGYSEVV